jgi:predicted transcriptional regulator
MKIKEIMELTAARCVSGDPETHLNITHGFACDLMSDVLTLDAKDLLLITGLCNTQTIRTAEMADVKCVLVVRGKIAGDDMRELAEESDIILLESPYSMFRAVSQLAGEGMKPVF